MNRRAILATAAAASLPASPLASAPTFMPAKAPPDVWHQPMEGIRYIGTSGNTRIPCWMLHEMLFSPVYAEWRAEANKIVIFPDGRCEKVE